jgi:hypothetical protein
MLPAQHKLIFGTDFEGKSKDLIALPRELVSSGRIEFSSFESVWFSGQKKNLL